MWRWATRARHSGDFELSISLNDFDIYGSPFHPIVHAAPTSGMHCVVIGEGVKVADAGSTNEFTIVARDQFDGERGVGGDTFEVGVVCGVCSAAMHAVAHL